MSQAQPAPTQHVDNLVSKAFTKLSKKVNKLQNSVDNVNTGRVQTAIALTVSLGILAVSVAELVVVFWGRRRGFLSTDIKMAVSYVLILAFYLWLTREARNHILAGDFPAWKAMMVKRVTERL